MEIANLSTEIIDAMSADDMRATLKEAYASASIERIKAEEEAKAIELQKAQDTAFLDSFFSSRFRK